VPVLLRLRATLAAGALALVAAAGYAGPARLGGLSEPHEVTFGAAAVTATTSTAVKGRDFAFTSLLDGVPVRWNPCAAIPWVSNARRGPAGGLEVLKAAVAKIAATTGTTWVYKGDVATVPRTGYLPRAAQRSYPPVLIGWADATTSDLLRGKPRAVLGVTRTAWFGIDDGTRRVAATRAAVVALDRTDRLPLRGASSWSSVALHELGHAFGLDHPSSASQLMAATLPRNLAGLQYGDVAGLKRLGRSAGCVVVPGA
jgi:hypothetical protein